MELLHLSSLDLFPRSWYIFDNFFAQPNTSCDAKKLVFEEIKIPKNNSKNVTPLKKPHPTFFPPKFRGKTPKLATLHQESKRKTTLWTKRLKILLSDTG